MAAQILGTFVRWGLMLLATWLIQHGVWTEAQAGEYVAYLVPGVVGILLVLAWSIWQKLKAHQVLKTALAAPAGTSLDKVKEKVALGYGAKLIGGFVLVAALLLPLAGCGVIHNPFKTPATLVTTEGKVAYTADQIVTRIREFQRTVIDYSRGGVIPLQTGREIVTWTVASLETIGKAPDGWQATVKAGWKNVRAKVAALPAVAMWAPIVDGLIGFIDPSPIFSPQPLAEALAEGRRWLEETP